jgi:hypothetical protein
MSRFALCPNSPSNRPISDQFERSRHSAPAVTSARSGGGVAPLIPKLAPGSARKLAVSRCA